MATNRWKEHALPLSWLAVVAFSPLGTAPFAGRTPWFGDITTVVHPIRSLARAAAAQGEAALWNPHSACGLPYTCDPSGGVAYPPNWLFDRMPPHLAITAAIVLHLWIAGALAYAAARARGASRLAGTLAGTAFALCGTVFIQIQSPNNLPSIAWTPALLLGASWIARGDRRRGFLATALGWAMSLAGGHQQFALFAAPAVAAVAWGAPGEPFRRRLTSMAAVAGGVLVGTVAAAAAILPAMLYVPITQRPLSISAERIDLTALAARDLLRTVFSRPENGMSLAVGFVALLLGTAFTAARWRQAAPLAIAAVFGALAALGRATPLGAALQAIPPFAWFQVPARHLEAVGLVLCLLAADGLDAWRRGDLGPRLRTATALALTALLAAAFLAEPGRASLRDAPRLAIDAAVLAVFLLGPARGNLRAAALVALAAAEFLVAEGRIYWRPDHTATAAEIAAVPPALTAVPADARDGSYRIVTSERPWHWHNQPAPLGIDSVRAHVALTPLRYIDLAHIANAGTPYPRRPLGDPAYSYAPDPARAGLLDLFALKYAVGFDASPGPRWRRVAPQVWERDCRMRQAEFVPHVVAVASREEAARAVADPAFDPVRTLVIEDEEGPAPAGDAAQPMPRVAAVRAGPRGARIEIEPGRDAWLLATWSRLPGLVATVDGNPAQTRFGDLAFTAVVVPAGTRVVELRYEPPGLAAGVWISAAGLAGLGAFACWTRRRTTPNEDTPGAAG